MEINSHPQVMNASHWEEMYWVNVDTTDTGKNSVRDIMKIREAV